MCPLQARARASLCVVLTLVAFIIVAFQEARANLWEDLSHEGERVMALNLCALQYSHAQ
jgi:hypothetical protein